ncbi:MAG: aminotransferase class V-fold PLP-dependent enzyme, partial [Myxococcales bacterium]|nr:aminotransferase class V-fold PLP-dependent enzyme [Myxococcales bacterium]
AALESLLLSRSASRRLVSVQAVNHETGVLQPLPEVRALCRAHGAFLHCDAVQAVGRLPAESHSGADLTVLASHKLRGPKGIGALATVCGIKLAPLLRGGEQERGMRPGTQDPIAAAGFGAVLGHAGGAERYARLAPLRDELEAAILDATPGARVNGDRAHRAPHVLNISIPGWLGPELAAALDLEGVSISSGSACSAGTADPSPVITAMVGVARARNAIRVSLGETTTPDQITEAIAAYRRVFARGSR